MASYHISRGMSMAVTQQWLCAGVFVPMLICSCVRGPQGVLVQPGAWNCPPPVHAIHLRHLGLL